MTAISNTPENLNFLSPINFKFVLKRAPHINFFIQKINIPGISLPSIEVNNPLIRVPYSGDHLIYEELTITFKVDEEFKNYMEISNWLTSAGKRDYDRYGDIAQKSVISGEGIYSDISVSILNSHRMPNYEIVYRDAIPISISSIDFDVTADDVDYVAASASFRYISFDIKKIS